MNRLVLILILTLASAIIACTNNCSINSFSDEQFKKNERDSLIHAHMQYMSEMSYHKDYQTNQCFAIFGWHYAMSVTQVPCTKEVEAQLVK